MKVIQYRWFLVALSFALAIFNYADRTAISSLFPLLRSDLGATDVSLAETGSFFLWSYALSSPIWGYLASRLSRARIVMWSVAATSLITLATAFVKSTDQLLLARIVLGLFQSAFLPASMALVADYHESTSRGTAIGIQLSGLNIGLVIGNTGAGYIGDHYGWRSTFIVLGGIGLMFSVIAHFSLHDAGQQQKEEQVFASARDVLDVLRIPSYLILVGDDSLQSIGLWIFYNWLPLYFSETFHMGLAAAGLAGTFMLQVAAISGITIGGVISDKIAHGRSERRMLLMSLCYIIAAPFLLPFGGRPKVGLIEFCIFVYSLFLTLGIANQTPIVCDLLVPRLRPIAFSLSNMSNCLAGGVSILVAGYVKRDYGLSGIFTFVACFVVAEAALTFTGYIFFLRRDLNRSAHAMYNPQS